MIIPNKDFNFTYLNEIINCYCAKRGRINEKTEEGKKGIVPNFKKSQREAKKSKMAYKIELDKIKVQTLQCTVTHSIACPPYNLDFEINIKYFIGIGWLRSRHLSSIF